MQKKYGLLLLLPLLIGHLDVYALVVERNRQDIELPATPDSAPVIEDTANCCPQPLPTFCVPKPVKTQRPCCPPPVCRPTRVACPPPIPCLRRCRLGSPAACMPHSPCLRPRVCRKKVYCCPAPVPCRPKPVCCPRIRCCRPKPRCCPPEIPPCPPLPCIKQPACIAVSQPQCPCDAFGNSTIPVPERRPIIPATMADVPYEGKPRLRQSPSRAQERAQAIDEVLNS